MDKTVKGLHFGPWPKPKRAFYFWLQAKKKKLFSLIREDPCLMHYLFNPLPPRPQRKIVFFWILPAGLQKITNSDKK